MIQNLYTFFNLDKGLKFFLLKQLFRCFTNYYYLNIFNGYNCAYLRHYKLLKLIT